MPLSLLQHYTQMWEQARTHFLEGSIPTDPLIDAPDDDRYGITLLLRLEEETSQKINLFLQEIKGLEPSQYYYPPSDQHLTVLSIISCYAGFQLSQIDVDAYDVLIKEVLPGIPPIKIHFKGITASPSTILIQGFPENDALQQLRNKLRFVFKNSKLQHSIDSRYALFTAHSTVIRFRKPLNNPETLVYALEKYRDADFGSVTAQQIELVANDWYQREDRVKLLRTYPLPYPH